MTVITVQMLSIGEKMEAVQWLT